MFTGIVEEIGTVRGVKRGNDSAVLSVGASTVTRDSRVGDSIAVNGVCLTLISVEPDGFLADVMPETLERSALGGLKPGSRVNLERAMAADGRFGGHIVSGHIDGTGVVSEIKKDGNAVRYTIRATKEILRLIVEKGSVAIDGISLTVARVDGESFGVSVIPHTAAVTTLGERRAGDSVNIENDCIGKYVERLLGKRTQSGKITTGFLAENGFWEVN